MRVYAMVIYRGARDYDLHIGTEATMVEILAEYLRDAMELTERHVGGGIEYFDEEAHGRTVFTSETTLDEFEDLFFEYLDERVHVTCGDFNGEDD